MASGSPPPPKEHGIFPGTYEELHKAAREIMPMPFEGIKLSSNAASTPHFQASHTLALTGSQPSSYKFGATYVGDNQGPEPGDQFPVLVSEMDTSGSLNAQVIHQLTERMRGRFILQTEGTSWENLQMDATYSGRDFSLTAVAANPDPLSAAGTFVGQFMQGITPNVGLGTELLYSKSAQGEKARLSLAGLFRGPRWQLAASANPSSLTASYYLKHSDTVQLGAELNANFGDTMKHTALMVGYKLDVPVANMTFRGMVDTNWTVGSVFEKRLAPYPFLFSLSAMLSHEQNAARVGVGLTIG
ncbi:mitochondrial import receptor subunit TOM40 homolog [Sycon ciliatum]|uniref:mitochondrial import receptor subunit TOM40 homolog n=1 Tax=Sycon ciliatum TaxID=27933 RepID=UPI0031F70C9A